QPVAVEFGLVVRDGDFSITGTPDVGNLDSVQDKVKVTVMPFLQPPTVTTLTVNPADVNIAGSPVQVAITVTATDDKQVQAVIAYVTATKLGTVLQVPLVHVTGDTYQGFLDSSNPRLTLNRDPFTGVVSPWSVSAFAFDADGGFGFVTDGTLTVRASGSATLPAVRLVGSGPAPLQNACFITPSSAPVQFLGPGDTIFLDVCMKPLQLLSRVTYQERFNQGHGGVVAGQEVDLPGPYAIPVDSLAGGEQTIRVKVYDRLGFTSFLDIPAVVDFGSPEVFIVAPNPTYQNVSFPFVVFIHDDTPKEVRVVLDGKVHILDTDNLAHAANITFLPEVDEDTGAFAATYLADLFGVELLDILESGADENHTLLHFLKDGDTYAFEFHLKRTVLGSATYTYEVRDIPGNRVTGAGSLLTINATTDIAVKNAYVVQTRLLPGDNATVRAVVRQKVGVTTVPVAVFFGADDMEEIVFGEAPVGQDIQIEFNRTFRPGIHELLVAAFAPPEVNETFEDDNLFEAEFEVFLGKTVKGEEEFYIRADERGLPDVAVMYLASTEKTFDLTLNQTGDVRYDFTAFGRSYYWDPLERNQTGKPVTTIPIEKTVKEKNQPLPFAVPLAAIAVAAALLRRRR
ncbi:MAG TPA: hypothetical protein VI796_07455, partial [Candidatus Thermoplasmatota archaeon]|nr:hypothetical protein [Candidatus Thermoplasmatota archaeon]